MATAWISGLVGLFVGGALGVFLACVIVSGANRDQDVRHSRLIRWSQQAIAVLDAHQGDQRALELVEYGRQLLRSED
jgi:hypothetical protein